MLLTAAALLAVTLSAPSAQVSLALPGLNGVNLSPGEAQLYSELLSQKLFERGLKVLSSRDITVTLGLEREKQLMGCSDESCVSELAGALGADGLVLGDVGKLGDVYAVNLKILSPEGKTLAVFNTQVPSADQLRASFGAGARALAHQLAGVMHRPELEPPPDPDVPVSTGAVSARRWSLVPLIGGVVVAGVGVVFEVEAGDALNRIGKAQTVTEAQGAHDDGKTFEALGHTLIGVGVAAVIAGVLMYALGESPPAVPSVALFDHGQGGWVGLTWSFR